MSGLFAKVGLDILDHPKFHAAEEEAPGAVSVWLWLTVHSRKHERGGEVSHFLARKACFQAGERFDACIASLAKHDLVYIDGDTLTVARYAEHNETKGDIATRRAETAERQQRYREKRNALLTRDSRVTNAKVTETSNALVTDSDSDSVSVSGSLSGESPRGGQVVPFVGPKAALHESPRVLTDCELAGIRKPTAADVIAMRAWYESESKPTPTSWEAALVRWMGNAKAIEARIPKAANTNATKGRAVQPVDPGTFGERPWET